MSSEYRVTGVGELRELLVKVELADHMIEVSGTVVDGYLHPEVEAKGPLLQLWRGPRKFSGGKVAVPVNVLNPMHLLSKLTGLREGQKWTIPLLDPLTSVFPDHGVAEIPLVEATVETDTLTWAGEDVSCFRIDYRPLDKGVTASTWVRRRDGLVLQQEARHQAMDLKLQRNPHSNR
jgi:hypothetical protein